MPFKKIKLIGEFITLSLLICFISAYFDLDLPLEDLLNKLKSKFLPAILFAAMLVFLNHWMLKKGGISEDKTGE